MKSITKTTLSLAAAMGTLALTANAATLAQPDYISDITAGGGVWDDGAFNTTTLVPGTASELFDGTKDTSGTSSVVGWNGAPGNPSSFPTLTFDLGGVFDVQTIDLWERPNNGTINSIDVSVSTDDVTYSAVTNYVPSWTSSTDQLDVSAFGDAQYVKLYLVSNDWSMLSEVEFAGTAVPEPSAAALLGLAGLALLRRRRK